MFAQLQSPSRSLYHSLILYLPLAPFITLSFSISLSHSYPHAPWHAISNPHSIATMWTQPNSGFQEMLHLETN